MTPDRAPGTEEPEPAETGPWRRWGVATASVVATLLAVSACASPDGEPAEDAVEDAPTTGVFGMAAPATRSVPSVVELVPLEVGPPEPSVSESATGTSPAHPPTIDQLGLQFTPRRLTVRLGSPVRFTNSESLAHNVHLQSIATGETLLDADTPPGEVVDFTFEEVGGYDVLCNTHPGMSAVVYVTDAPHAVFADEDGAFELPDAVPGRYLLRVWSVDPALRVEQEVDVPTEGAAEVDATPSR